MKRILTIILLLSLIFSLSACGGKFAIGSDGENSDSIGNADLTLCGKAKRSRDNIVTVGGGEDNKAYLKGGFQSSHFSMSAKFKVAKDSNFSFVMGKDSESFGFWVELISEDGKSYLNIYKDLSLNVSSGATVSEELDFSLRPDEEYTLKLTFDIWTKDISTKEMLVEILGDVDEYFSYTTDCNAYGNPFYYSNAKSCTVYDYSLSLNHYYDIDTTKVAIFGHSFVEGDSLLDDRAGGFAYLLEDELGQKKVLNFGLGGDTVSGMNEKIANSKRFIKNCDYALLCIGTNDLGLSSKKYIKELKKSIKLIEKMDITPILFTIPHAYHNMTDDMIAINDWIRNSGYHYVDMYEVFANDDGSCKKELFMDDKIHPTIEGHAYILKRIKTDCPFLF